MHDHAGTSHEELIQLASEKILSNIERRLRLDIIDDETVDVLRQFVPVFRDNLDLIIDDFYRHVTNFPETKKFFSKTNIPVLKQKQIQHWSRMLECRFDKAYINGAVRVGVVHHKIGLPLFLYLAGYNRILCDMTSIAIQHHMGAMVSSQLVSAIIKVVSLDMDIAISCYFIADKVLGTEKTSTV